MSALERKSDCRPVMAVGLDGLTLDLLLPYVEAGRLPTFAKLLSEGAWGTLGSVGNTMTGPTWATLATGAAPQDHGVLHDYHHDLRDYRLRQTTGADVRLPGVWSLASDAGRRVIVLNVPHTYPAPKVNGVLLAGIDAPSTSAAGFDHPPGSYLDLVHATGDYLIDCGGQAYLEAAKGTAQQEAIEAAVAAVDRETEGRTRAAEYFATQAAWDLLVVVYSLPDIWQHYFWHAIQAPANTPGARLVESGYVEMDHHLARLLALLPTDGRLVVFSDHGFGRTTGSRQLLNERLHERGWLAHRHGRRQQASQGAFHALLAFARNHTSYNARQRLLSAWPTLQKAVDTRLNIGDIDWSRTRAYAALDHRELWLNVRGRQRQGVVDPGEVGSTMERLRSELLDWRDPTTGESYVSDVRAFPYRGEPMTGSRGHDRFFLPPDLAIEWNPDVAPLDAHPTMSGDHLPNGAVVVWGHGVAPGEIHGARLSGIAAYLLTSLDVAAPPWMNPPIDVHTVPRGQETALP